MQEYWQVAYELGFQQPLLLGVMQDVHCGMFALCTHRTLSGCRIPAIYQSALYSAHARLQCCCFSHHVWQHDIILQASTRCTSTSIGPCASNLFD
jgi:hypothetical protein